MSIMNKKINGDIIIGAILALLVPIYFIVIPGVLIFSIAKKRYGLLQGFLVAAFVYFSLVILLFAIHGGA